MCPPSTGGHGTLWEYTEYNADLHGGWDRCIMKELRATMMKGVPPEYNGSDRNIFNTQTLHLVSHLLEKRYVSTCR